MIRSIPKIVAGALLLAVAHGAQAQPAAKDRWTIIHAGTLMAEAGKPSKPQQSIVVRNDRIEAVRDGFVDAQSLQGADAADVRIIDLKTKFVMSGLLDAHVHVAGRAGFVGGLRVARDKLLTGATTVRDGGSSPALIFAVRDAINEGLSFGPRILAAGDPVGAIGGETGVCAGVEGCTLATRRQILAGADQIKLLATGGVGDNYETGFGQQMTDAELRAVVEAAALMQRKVMAHAIGVEGVKAAVRAGVASIEHGNDLDDETAQLMKQRGTYLVPTLLPPSDVLKRLRNPATAGSISGPTRRKMLGMAEAQPGQVGRQVKVAMRNGVKIAVASDAGGTIGDEMVLLVEAGGMTPEAVLKAATVGNADLFGMTNQIGSVAAGKSADIIALDSDPRQDIRAVTRPTFVMAMGRQAKGEGFTLP